MSYGYPATFSRQRSLARAEERTSYLARLDWVLVVAAALLSVYGAVLVWSASRADLAPKTGDLQYYLKRHLLNAVIGVVLALVASRIDYRLLRAYTPVLYVVAFGLLFATRLPVVGQETAGAAAWVRLPAGFTLQPAELAKIAVILAMAMILAEKRDSETEPRGSDVLQALAVAALPMAVVLVYQKDTGTVLIMACIALAVVAVSGARSAWVAGLLGGAVLAVLLVIQFNPQLGLLKEYQVQRLTSFVNPDEADSRSEGFNTEQARIAFGSGGAFGKGLFHGPQTQGKFVPVNESDFIMTVAGEELGFVGSAGVVALLGVILWRGVRIALRASDLFGRLLSTGIVAWLAFQAFENIGMNLGIMPVTGVPLPFVSYGGTSMFACWICVGLLLNVHMRRAE